MDYPLSVVGWSRSGAVLQNATAVKVGIVTSLIIPSEALWRRAAFEMQSPISAALGVSPFGDNFRAQPVDDRICGYLSGAHVDGGS